jgi:hypothetical protein
MGMARSRVTRCEEAIHMHEERLPEQAITVRRDKTSMIALRAHPWS